MAREQSYRHDVRCRRRGSNWMLKDGHARGHKDGYIQLPGALSIQCHTSLIADRMLAAYIIPSSAKFGGRALPKAARHSTLCRGMAAAMNANAFTLNDR